MNDIEFFAKLNAKRLTSLDEDHKRLREEYFQDIKNRELKRSGKLPEPEITRERDPLPKTDLEMLLRSGQVLPASELAKQKEDAQRAAEAFEEAIQSEQSHRRTKIATGPDKTVAHLTREPFQE